jgi:hypothetical protein
MRYALAVVLLAGCPRQSSTGDDTYIPPGGYEPGGCHADSDCSPDLCTRDGECLSASEIWSTRLTWTISGQTASDATCTSGPDFYVQFDGPVEGDGVGFAPVPCNAGIFSVDKLPRRFQSVSIGVDNGGVLASGVFDGNGHAAFDLP